MNIKNPDIQYDIQKQMQSFESPTSNTERRKTKENIILPHQPDRGSKNKYDKETTEKPGRKAKKNKRTSHYFRCRFFSMSNHECVCACAWGGVCAAFRVKSNDPGMRKLSSSASSGLFVVDSGSCCSAASPVNRALSLPPRGLGDLFCRGCGTPASFSRFTASFPGTGVSSRVASLSLAIPAAADASDTESVVSSSDESTASLRALMLLPDDLEPKLFRRWTARADAMADFQRARGLKCSRRPVERSCSAEASWVVSHCGDGTFVRGGVARGRIGNVRDRSAPALPWDVW